MQVPHGRGGMTATWCADTNAGRGLGLD